MKRLIVFILLVSAFTARAEEWTVYGRAGQGAGYVIGLYQYVDYITYTEKKLAEAITGDSGKFSMTVEVDEISWMMLRCENLHGFVFATPGKTSEVYFPARDPDYHLSKEAHYEVPISIWVTDSSDMNFLAADYNKQFNFFWGDSTSNKYLEFVAGQSAEVLDTFHNQMTRYYRWVTNPYFPTWLEYGFAQMENATFQSEHRTAGRYLINKPIMYHNHEYMNFFNNFFEGFVYRWSMRKQGSTIYRSINDLVNYDSAMASLRHLPYMKNDTLRELVLLKGLVELYYNMAYDPRNVIAVAQQAGILSPIKEHREIARNIVQMFSKLRVGSMAPHFAGLNLKGEQYDPLELYKGKYIYIFFYASWNTNSVNEMRYMAELQKKYGKTIQFVSVSMDEDTAAWKKFLRANPKYNWLQLHYDFDNRIKDNYNIFGYPIGYLVDPDGKLYASPADKPSGYLEFIMDAIVNPKKKKP